MRLRMKETRALVLRTAYDVLLERGSATTAKDSPKEASPSDAAEADVKRRR